MTDPSRRDRSPVEDATDPAAASERADHPDEPQAEGSVSHEVELSPEEVARHWSDERRRHAAPREQRRSPPTVHGPGPEEPPPHEGGSTGG